MVKTKAQWHCEQVEEFKKLRPVYQVYAETLEEVLKNACKVFAPYSTVESRAKTLSSFAEKALRKADKYDDPVNQLTDLCGVRVITQTLSDVKRICKFIRENFQVDEANSEDKLQLLGPTQFTYLSVHYVVQLKQKKLLGIAVPPKIGDKKAEIQVRTLLQHAWAGISHDRLYKCDFMVPVQWQREANRLSAVLEEVDKAFDQFLVKLDVYATHRGVYKTDAQLKADMESLMIILANEEDKSHKIEISLRIAGIAKALGDWKAVIDFLKPFKKISNAKVQRELGRAYCFKEKPNLRKAELYLKNAVELDTEDAESWAALGWLYEKQDEDGKARNSYARAFELKPVNPYYMISFIEYEIYKRGFSGIGLIRPILQEAIDNCRLHAEVNIELPFAYFTMGKCYLLLREPYKGLNAYAKALQLCIEDKEGIPEDVVLSESKSLNRLETIKNEVIGIDWFKYLLKAGQFVRKQTAVIPPELRSPAFEKCKKPEYFKDLFKKTTSIIIVAGSCGKSNDDHQKKMYKMFSEAFEEFKGVIISGGTESGISGVVGMLSEKKKEKSDSDLITIGYLPASIPCCEKLDERYDEHLFTSGKEFSAMEPLRIWIDLLAAGVKPSQVKLIGVDGGQIAAFEYRLAAALGATVGILNDKGGASSDLLKDEAWKNSKGICTLPFDPMTLKAFITEIDRDTVDFDLDLGGRIVHDKYREENWKKLTDVSMRPWEKLPDYLKKSNEQQVLYARNVLRKYGFELKPVESKPSLKESSDCMKFTKDEIEKMAEMEHGRWNVERIKDGWKLGPRDPSKKISPYLVAWPQLPEEIKDYDRKAVRDWIEVFKRLGLEITKDSKKVIP